VHCKARRSEQHGCPKNEMKKDKKGQTLRRVYTKENIRRRIVRSNERMIGKKMFVSVAIRRLGAHQRRHAATVASINAKITQRENVQWGSANTNTNTGHHQKRKRLR
jgi:hypothetical protein